MDHSISAVDAVQRILATLQPCLIWHVFKSVSQGKRHAPAFQLKIKDFMLGTQFLLIKVIDGQLPPSRGRMSFLELFDSFLHRLLWG
jgi:hypothetical protein